MMGCYEGGDVVNVGCGQDLTIRDLAELVARVVGYSGQIVFDSSKPDGTPRKLLDISRATSMGWQPAIPLEEGLRATYDWFRSNVSGLEA
jgi:GDP-L-fucose synthase